MTTTIISAVSVAVTILIALAGLYAKLNQPITESKDELNQRIIETKDGLNQRSIETKDEISHLAQRVARIEGRMDPWVPMRDPPEATPA